MVWTNERDVHDQSHPSASQNFQTGSRTISLKIKSATGLKKSSRLSRDPKTFVQIKIDGQTYATHVSQRTTNPVWDEEFIILLQGQGWSTEFYLRQDKSISNGNLIAQCHLTDTQFEALLYSRDGPNPAPQRLDLNTVNTGTNTVKLEITVTQLLVSSPRMYFLEKIHEHSQFDLSQITAPPAQSSNDLNASNVNVSASVLGVMSSISQLKPIIDRLATVHPYVNLAWQILTAIHNSTEAQRQRDERVIALVTSMQAAIRWLVSLDPLTKIELLETSFTELFDLCCRCGIFIQWYCSRFIRDIMSNVEERIQTLENSFHDSIKNFSMALKIQTVIATANIDQANKNDKANELIQKHLPYESATWDPTLTCLKGTREDILQEIFTWVDHNREKNVFWLAGLAGSGKSTIAHTVASALSSTNRLGGCFFFARHQSKRNEANLVMSTVAHGISAFAESVRDSLVTIINRNSNVAKGPLRRQFLDLVVEPLKSYSGKDPIVIVFDALDECATPAMREDLLTILAHDSAQLPPNVLLFITARPERDIEEAFSLTSKCHRCAINLDSSTNIEDITIYVKHHLAKIASAKGIKGEWPSELRRTEFVRRSTGLFIWAATACEFVRRSFSPEKALDRLVSEELPTSATAAIDSLYATALQAVEGWQDEDFIPAYQVVVGTIISLKNPLPSSIIEQLLGPELNGVSVNRVVSSLGCVLSGSEDLPIRVLHPSFSEYLTSESRCKNPDTYIDVSQNHGRLSHSSLSLMNASLKYNICGFSHPSQSTLESQLNITDIPGHLRYACHFWAEHVVRAGGDDDLQAQVYKFLLTHGLHWMEVMSLIGLAGHIRSSLHVVRIWAQDSRNADLERLAYDLERFSQTFSNVMSDFPLHLYVSALPFAPLGTFVHQEAFVKDRVNTIKVLSGSDQRWPRCFQILEGHEGYVRCVAFSPKGMLASGGDDATVRIWNLLDGTSYLELIGHKHPVTSVAFSSNGNKVITGSIDKMAFIWDSASGECLASLKDHRLPITSVAFTQDRTRAITGSMDRTIRVWDATFGSQSTSPIDTRQTEISCIAVSSRSNLVASGSFDGILEPMVHPSPRDTEARVTSVAFSHDENTVTSAYRDGCVNIWSVSTGEKLKSIKVSSRTITSVEFTHDDSVITVGCNDNTISLWDVHTGKMVIGSPIEGHSGPVSAVALSADGSVIASGSHDSKIRLWEYLECVKSPPSWQVEGHKNEITVIAFNSDKSLVASGDKSGSVCVWRCSNGELLHNIPDIHRGSVMTLAFSVEGDMLLSGGEDTIVACWSLKKKELSWTSKEAELAHERAVSASAFNHKGTKVATGGRDRYIFLWDTDTGGLSVDEPLENENGYWIEHLAFSADDTELLSIDSHANKAYWDVDTGVLVEEEGSVGDFNEYLDDSNKFDLDEIGWVIEKSSSRQIFWVPPDHRGKVWAASDETFVIGNKYGVVTIIDISQAFL
ncbi:hypothetical protein Clacol_005605 [Clathrus columnatus]|uniref:WD40 repeat-like protein n=1 Tax=Clathrus columnatus TaxID=1419009 RepID=A0AAV5AD23_9AGAM|nr:hypothetical protein Clacol_005605 [Clathrus columnatus]